MELSEADYLVAKLKGEVLYGSNGFLAWNNEPTSIEMRYTEGNDKPELVVVQNELETFEEWRNRKEQQ